MTLPGVARDRSGRARGLAGARDERRRQLGLRAARAAIPSAPIRSSASIPPTTTMPTARLERAAGAGSSARALPPMFRVTPLAAAASHRGARRAGWAAFDRSHRVRPWSSDPAAGRSPARASCSICTIRRWLDAQQQLQRLRRRRRSTQLARSCGAIDVPAAASCAYARDGVPVAAALMAVADGIVIYRNVITDASARAARAMAAAMMRTALNWARAAGATHRGAQGAGRQCGGASALYARARLSRSSTTTSTARPRR